MAQSRQRDMLSTLRRKQEKTQSRKMLAGSSLRMYSGSTLNSDRGGQASPTPDSTVHPHSPPPPHELTGALRVSAPQGSGPQQSADRPSVQHPTPPGGGQASASSLAASEEPDSRLGPD